MLPISAALPSALHVLMDGALWVEPSSYEVRGRSRHRRVCRSGYGNVMFTAAQQFMLFQQLLEVFRRIKGGWSRGE